MRQLDGRVKALTKHHFLLIPTQHSLLDARDGDPIAETMRATLGLAASLGFAGRNAAFRRILGQARSGALFSPHVNG
jgi:hypothetical protein